MTPSTLLSSVGRALYGDRWRRPLAAALGVHEGQLRRWETGGRLTPEHPLFAGALDLLEQRRTEISGAIRQLKKER